MGCLIEPTRVLTASASYPELCIEWMPTQGPFAADGDWCDITSYVIHDSCKTKRGRQFELDRFSAGQFNLTLRSTTRLFDPENTAGPFYPYLVPMRQLRVSAVWNSVRYPLFRGHVTSWGQTQPDDKVFITDIVVKDSSEQLEQYKLPSSAWALEIINDDPTAWFRLGESDTVRITDNSANGNYGIYDNCQQGQTGLVVNDADGAVSFAHSLEERAVIQNPNLITGYPFTVSMMFKIDGTDPGGQKTMWSGLMAPPQTTGTAAGMSIVMIASGSTTAPPGAIFVRVNDGSTKLSYYFSVRSWSDNLPHHLVVVYNSTTSANCYIDGVDVTVATAEAGATSWVALPPNGWVIGNYTDLAQGDYGFGTNADGLGINSQNVHRGTLDEVCVWNGIAVTATRIAAHALAAKTGWEGDDTGARVTRFLDRIGWPATMRSISSGASILGPAEWSTGASALSVLQAWADTELGQFLIGTNGELIWTSRHAAVLVTTSTTSQATFGDHYAATNLKYDNNGLDLPRDETLIRNPVQASRRNGVTVTVKNQRLIEEKYGARQWSAPGSEDQKDAAVRDRAFWLLARYQEQGTRLKTMYITPLRDPTNLWPQVLGRSIGERITIKRTPLGIGSEISVDVIIEGIEHEFSPREWRTKFVGSPIDPNVGDYLILDGAGSMGFLDQQLLAY